MSSYSEGQTHQLMEALQANGFTSAHVTKLGQYDRLGDVRLLLDGMVKIVAVDNVIHLDADPVIREGWSVVEHRRHNPCAWGLLKVGLYVPDQQKNGKFVGNELRDLMKDQSVFNANLLDYLLARPALIPDKWKQKSIYFWGTIFRNEYGELCVRYMHSRDGLWRGDYRRLSKFWYPFEPAVVNNR